MRKSGLLLILLAACLLFGTSIEIPQLVSQASAMVVENGTVYVPNAELRELEINLSIPLATPYQQVRTDEQVRQDTEGNHYVRIYSPRPPNPFQYSKLASVQTSARTLTQLPVSYVVPLEYVRYYSPTGRTQSDNPQIRQLAQSIAANSTTQFEKVAKLAIFVHQYLTYNENLVGQENDALWTLQNRQGVCVEYSTLFAALARSLGIPTRYLTGYVYSDRYSGWLGHAWNEVYLGEWVPVDSTWFEVGSLDALHIEAGKFSELSREPTLIASVSRPEAQIIWETTGKSGAFADNIITQSISAGQPESNYNLDVAEAELAPGDSTIAFLEMTSDKYQVIPVELAGCKGGESVTVEGGKQYLILEPGKKAVAVWVLRASDSLPWQYVFTCPLTLNSPYLSLRTVDVKVDPRVSSLAPFQATISQPSGSLGETVSVLLTVPQARQGKDFYLVSPTESLVRTISSSTANLPFSVSSLGAIPIYLASEGGGYKKLTYLSGANSSISIESLEVPETLVQGVVFTARATVSALSYPAEVQLEFDFGGEKKLQSGQITGPTRFNFEFTPKITGPATATLAAYHQNELADSQSLLSEVQEQPLLSIANVRVSKEGGATTASISFSYKGQMLSPTIKIGNSIYSATSEVKLRLPEGQYAAELSWKDILGNQYTKQERLSISEPGLLGQIAPPAAPSGQPQACPLALVLLSSGMLLAITRR